MGFTSTPLDGSATPVPMSSAVPDGTNTPLAIEGGPSIVTGGNTLVPVSMYVKDGNDVTLGTSTDAANANTVVGQLKQINTNLADTLVDGDFLTTISTNTGNTNTQATSLNTVTGVTGDAAVTGDNTGTVSAKLRGLAKIFFDIWDSTNHWFRVSQGAAASASVTLQSAQAGNAVGTPLSVLGMSSALLTVNMAGYTGTVNFEGQEDGTNFKALFAVLIGTSTITSTAVGAVTTSINLYEIPVAGLQQIQARTSGASAGSVTVTGHAVPVPYNGKVVNANVVNATALGQSTMVNSSPVAIASDQSAVKGKGDFLEVAGQGTGVVNAINTDLIPSTDVSGYKTFSLHLTGTYVGILSFQCSNDGVNFVALNVININSSGSYTTATTSGQTGVIFYAPITFRFLRVRMTTFTSNTSLAGMMELYTYAVPVMPISSVRINDASGNSVLSNGGALDVALAHSNGVVAVAGSLNVKASAGYLQGCLITTAGIVSITFFDNAAGNSTGNIIGITPPSTSVGQFYPFNMPAVTGISAVGGAGSPAVTVAYS